MHEIFLIWKTFKYFFNISDALVKGKYNLYLDTEL